MPSGVTKRPVSRGMRDQVIGYEVMKIVFTYEREDRRKVFLETVPDAVEIHVGIDVKTISTGKPPISQNGQNGKRRILLFFKGLVNSLRSYKEPPEKSLCRREF